MKLQMASEAAIGFKSASQITRRITEHWGASNLYCVACTNDLISPTPPNTKAVDFRCGNCGAPYQLKAGRGWSEVRVPDAGYAAIRADATPNLLLMQYSLNWRVQNLVLVPSFFLTESVIERRPPLSMGARRAGWIGCNILLGSIAGDGKIRLVQNAIAIPARAVRDRYRRVLELSKLGPRLRGWTLDVLHAIRSLDRVEFTLADIYEQEGRLSALHPMNKNVRAKIRQQLQVLRDAGLVRFHGGGSYSVT